MSELAISSINWLAISLRNSTAIVFNLNDVQQWQYLESLASTNQPNESTDNKQNGNEKEKNDDDDDNSHGLNRNLIRFTPNGQKLVINGQNKQISVYILSYNDSAKTYWQLQRTITVKKRASALDLTNELLLIADKSGDVYRTDLSADINLSLTFDDCIMGHLSMLLDIVFFSTINNQQFILTADRDEKIRLSHYPNAYNIEGYCLGHREFVSHVKLIDQNHILSASGDGSLRHWQLPDCVELNVYQSKEFLSSCKNLFYGLTSTSDTEEKPLDSSPINYSIWKMDVASAGADSSSVFVALSIYAYRNHTIYLTTLEKLDESPDETCKLTFHAKYGPIIDYCFTSRASLTNSQCYLYILFGSNILLEINLIAIFSYDKNELTENDSSISRIINTKDFHFTNNISSNEIIFKQLFKMHGNPGDSAYFKRKNERIEQQEEKRRKKQVATQFQEKVAINENA